MPPPGGDEQRLGRQDRHGTNVFCELGPREILGLLGTAGQRLTPKASPFLCLAVTKPLLHLSFFICPCLCN